MATVNRFPTHSMKSTWRTDHSQWGFWHYLLDTLGMHPSFRGQDPPKHAKTDKMPYLPESQLHKWIIFHSVIPLLIQQAYVQYSGRNFGPITAFLFYSIAFKATAIHELHVLRYFGQIYGFFDGDSHPRDEVPDMSVGKVARSLLSTSTFRPMMAVALSYDASLTPASTSWFWLPLEVGIYGIILDFWFYWYHRLMHHSDILWKYHRTHHLTKHPNPLLTLYADSEQELFDIAGIPLLTWGSMKLLGLPMGFYEWWICFMYVVFPELFGHSGLRVWGSPPSTLSWLLRLTSTELVIEDHDLHHRNGWKKSGNYGKQTRLWDVLFGTAQKRIECIPENVDFSMPITIPLFSYPKIRI